MQADAKLELGNMDGLTAGLVPSQSGLLILSVYEENMVLKLTLIRSFSLSLASTE